MNSLIFLRSAFSFNRRRTSYLLVLRSSRSLETRSYIRLIRAFSSILFRYETGGPLLNSDRLDDFFQGIPHLLRPTLAHRAVPSDTCPTKSSGTLSLASVFAGFSGSLISSGFCCSSSYFSCVTYSVMTFFFAALFFTILFQNY